MATPSATDRMWSRAFASQAISDLDTRWMLARTGAAKCHRLHFLQMASEKLCKAFLKRANGYGTMKLTHAVVEKHLAFVISSVLAKEGYSSSVLKARLKGVRLLGREIELLSPACDAEGIREDNSEYPWQISAGAVQIPHEYSFPNLNEESKGFISRIKLMRTAAETYLA